MTEFVEHLPHYPNCRRANWWKESESGSNSIPLLKCWECGYSFIIGSKNELIDLDTRKIYIIKTKKRVVEDFIGYEVEQR